jgi:cob(I)alamin adenosyltransferase
VEDRDMNDKPRILIFTGDGKGKTTAALGMAFRASGHGMNVAVVQFIKSDASVGEVAAAAANPHIEIHQTGMGFVPPDDSPQLAMHRNAAQEGLAKAGELIASRRFELVILDEICSAVARGLVEERQVVELLEKTPAAMCVVLTGRGATHGLIMLADTVTEMLAIKHGMAEGWTAQKGVEL